MHEIIQSLRERAKQGPKKIAFSEYQDERVLTAIKIIEKEKIAYPYLCTAENIEDKKKEEFGQIYYEKKKQKGVTIEAAMKLMEDPLYYSAMLTKSGYVDGFVSGASLTSASVVKAAIACLDLDEEIPFMSSSFIMSVPDCPYGEKGVFVFADCAVNPYPDSLQLSSIALVTAKFTQRVLGIIPRVAFLSYSTKGSAFSKGVEKIKEAVEIVQSKNPSLFVEGELQADAALVPEVARRKFSESEVVGKANVLIFPNLDAANISYKLIQRLAKARAVGPSIIGVKQPCSDLSRGCDVDDIIDATAVTVIRGQKRNGKEKVV